SEPVLDVMFQIVILLVDVLRVDGVLFHLAELQDGLAERIELVHGHANPPVRLANRPRRAVVFRLGDVSLVVLDQLLVLLRRLAEILDDEPQVGSVLDLARQRRVRLACLWRHVWRHNVLVMPQGYLLDCLVPRVACALPQPTLPASATTRTAGKNLM